MICVRSTVPTRVDLAGGTLDLWPIHHLLDRKATVNIGVTLEAQVEVRCRDDHLFEIKSTDQNIQIRGNLSEACATKTFPLAGLLLGTIWPEDGPGLSIVTSAKSPLGAGLGGSSCLGIGIAAALLKTLEIWQKENQREVSAPLPEESLVRLVQDVEARLIRTPTGSQDYWGGVRGRVNIISFPYGGTKVETLPPDVIRGLKEQLILCYSGQSRASAINNWEIFKRLFDGDLALLEVFQEIGSLSEACASHIRRGRLGNALELSHQEWKLRTQLWPAIETAETKRLDLAAKKNGALFSRVCGAGGGGVMAIFAPPEAREKVVGALEGAGGKVLTGTIAETGLTLFCDSK